MQQNSRIFPPVKAEGYLFELVEGEGALDDVGGVPVLGPEPLIAAPRYSSVDLHWTSRRRRKKNTTEEEKEEMTIGWLRREGVNIEEDVLLSSLLLLLLLKQVIEDRVS